MYSKKQAIQAVVAKGYSVHHDTGECGDGGYGSRLYYSKPNCETNKWGAPLEWATLSRLPRTGWLVDFFGGSNGN